MGIRKSLILSFSQKYTSILFQFVSMLVLARLLTPEEVGVFAMGAAMIGIANVFSDLGQLDYLIKVKDLNPRKLTGAFGLSLATTLICIVALIAINEGLYRERENNVYAVINVLIIALSLKPFSLLYRAQLFRQLNFKQLYIVDTTKDALVAFGSITFVLFGFSSTGLALGLLAEEIALICFAISQRHKIPYLMPGLRGIKEHVSFGLLKCAVQGSTVLAESFNRIIISKLIGFDALGLLNRSQKITQIFDKAVVEGTVNVMLPHLAEEVRNNNQLGAIYCRKAVYLSGVAWPFFGFLAVAAEPIVLLLLGPQWLDSVPIVRILCLTGILIPFGAGVFTFLVSLGLLRNYLPFQLMLQTLVIGAAYLGSLISIEWACSAILLNQLGTCAGTYWILKNRIDIDLLQHLPSFIKSALIGVFSVAIALLLMQYLPIKALSAIWLGCAFALVWLLSIFATRHPLALEIIRIRGSR